MDVVGHWLGGGHRSERRADPRWVWDPEADPLVASLLDRGDVPRVNELLRTWTKNGQPLPAGLPADLRDFMEQARRLPSWADQGKLATARYLAGDQVAGWDGIPREPFWERTIATMWPILVKFREGLVPLPLVPEIAWTIDESLRR